MRALVTGGAGFVGTNLIKRLLKDGHEVVSVDNYSTGKKENEQEGCQYYDKDLSNSIWWGLWDEDECDISCDCQIEPVDIIFHLSALPRIVPSFEKPLDTYKSGPLATINVLEWARHWETPVIYAGSSSVTGDVYANPYTFTKWQNEHLLELYNKIFKVPTSICRFYNVYGEHQASEGSYCNVLGIFERKFKKGKPLTITGDGEQRRDFTHVDDVVDGLIKCAEHTSDITSTYEFGRGKNFSINEIAEMFRFGDMPHDVPPVKYIDSIPGESRETLRTNDHAKNVLKWKPTRNVEDWIKENII